MRLTAYGADVVKEQILSPYDPDGYLKELESLAPRLANLCDMYIAQALSCFGGGSYLATAVMLGAASEGNILDLFDRYHEAMAKGGVHEHSGYQAKLQKAHSFYDKYKVFRRYFDPVRAKLPSRLVDDLDGQTDGCLASSGIIRTTQATPQRRRSSAWPRSAASSCLRLILSESRN